jgi:hypothetical protein
MIRVLILWSRLRGRGPRQQKTHIRNEESQKWVRANGSSAAGSFDRSNCFTVTNTARRESVGIASSLLLLESYSGRPTALGSRNASDLMPCPCRPSRFSRTCEAHARASGCLVAHVLASNCARCCRMRRSVPMPTIRATRRWASWAGIFCGTDKLARLAHLAQDPAVAEVLGIEAVPSRSTLSRFLARCGRANGEAAQPERLRGATQRARPSAPCARIMDTASRRAPTYP